MKFNPEITTSATLDWGLCYFTSVVSGILQPWLYGSCIDKCTIALWHFVSRYMKKRFKVAWTKFCRWHVVQKYIKRFFVLPHNSCIFVAMRRAHGGMWIQLNFQRYFYFILAFLCIILFRFSFWLSRKYEPTNRPSNAWRGKRSNGRPFVKQSSGT